TMIPYRCCRSTPRSAEGFKPTRHGLPLRSSKAPDAGRQPYANDRANVGLLRAWRRMRSARTTISARSAELNFTPVYSDNPSFTSSAFHHSPSLETESGDRRGRAGHRRSPPFAPALFGVVRVRVRAT